MTNARTALIAQHAGLAVAGPIGSFDAYLERVSRIPVLDREHEQQLAQRFRRDNDLDAARELVLSHLRFVVHIARGYAGYGLPMNDLVQEGNIGLMKAVKRFDPNVGADPMHAEGHQAHPDVGVEALDGFHQPDIAFLNQIVHG